MLEDTRRTLTDLQRISADPGAQLVLEPLLPHALALYEISSEELLRTNKADLSEEDRIRLQHCVVSNKEIFHSLFKPLLYAGSFGNNRRSHY